MSTGERQGLCAEVEENLTSILDGTASARLFDHAAECDACRDLRHEADGVGERVAASGADFRAPEGFAERLLAKLDEARPSGPLNRPSATQTSIAEPAPRSGATVSSTKVAVSSGERAATSASKTAISVIDEAKTTFDPLAAAKAEAEGASEPLDAKTTFDPLAAAKAGENEHHVRGDLPPNPPGEPIHHTQPSAQSSPSIKEIKETIAAEPAHAKPESTHAPEQVEASTHHEPAPSKAAGETAIASPTAAPEGESNVVPIHKPLAKKPSAGKRTWLIGGAIAATLAVAAGAMMFVKGKGPGPLSVLADDPWSGSIAKVSRASADKSGGFELCDTKGACAPAAEGGAVKAGSVLRTDARTRAHVTLADGTVMALDRATEIEIASGKDRVAKLRKGTIVTDVAHVDGKTAKVTFPRGEVEVLGTKLSVSASDERASVEVARGLVRVTGSNGKSVDVRAGEEATIVGSSDPVVASTSSLADVMEWSDQKPEEVDSPTLRGIGELRARKPGQTKEKDQAVKLTKHSVKVRVVDVVARTEIDETFTNETDEELEGIYRFPLPPGAQIERLALEVDGKLMEGAFVDRDRGAAIWRGVIQNAAPKAPKPREEIVWVPGPWRDPALLEWQRGGRFELRIFPIPKKGSRRVVLAYTQLVEQSGGTRRYSYPLAHDASGTTKIDAFDMDVQVLGADKTSGMNARGYELASAGDDRRTFHANGFVPAGDLNIEYSLPNRDKEVTAWAYEAPPAAAPEAPAQKPTKPLSKEEQAGLDAAKAIAQDASPYVALAIRPKLPRWQEAKERTHVIVVDSSRSMFGERFARASRLASSMVREMDRRDSFLILACDTTCKPMTDEAGGAPKPEAPGAAASAKVDKFLGAIEPDGGSDLAAAMSAARALAGVVDNKELRVIYLGDGTPSVGPTKPSHIEAAVKSALFNAGRAFDTQVIAVALGSDADTTSLKALARGGGGVLVPYTPGQKVSTAAIEVLSAAYGVALRDIEVELPSGLTQVTPAQIDPVRAGGETILVARMSGREIKGTLKLKGKVANERFEQSYPVELVASQSSGNAFVPRLYAAAKIAELERVGGEGAKPMAIELSKRFAVASRFTSLLVLESEAMFKAFGLDQNKNASAFTGEVGADSRSTGVEGGGEAPEEEAKAGDKDMGAMRADAPVSKGKKSTRSFDGDGDGAGLGGFAGPPMATAVPMAPAPAPKPSMVSGDPFADDLRSPAKQPAARPRDWNGGGGGGWRGRRRLVPMRRVFDRNVSFDAQNTFLSQNIAKIAAAEAKLSATPDSRDKTVELYSLYATSGRLGEAQELTAKWSGRDALDPDALTARADLAARQGDRARAIRILSGLTDVRPNDRAIQTRLAELHEAAGNRALACEHRVALADIASNEAKLIADAVSCARAQGFGDLASVVLLDAGEKVRQEVDKILANAQIKADKPMLGDVQITGEWTGGTDVDIALVDNKGARTSWLGSPLKVGIASRDAASTQRESLAISNLPQGSYVIEVSRASGGDSGSPVRGELTIRTGNETRKVPFNLTGARAEAGTVKIFFTSRLVPF